jgi:hypothetical protein
MSLQEAAEAGLLSSLVVRAMDVVARTEALRQQPGPFMDSLEAARLFGSMSATIEGLVHELYVAGLYTRGLQGLLAGEVTE